MESQEMEDTVADSNNAEFRRSENGTSHFQTSVDGSGPTDGTKYTDITGNDLESDDVQLTSIALLALSDLTISERTGEHNDEKRAANDKSPGYVTPIEDPFVKAHRYSAKHNILDLFQAITAGIAYFRPENPIEFMIAEIGKLQEQEKKRKGQTPNT